MSASNSAAADLSDADAARLALDLANERFLPIQARYHEADLARQTSGRPTDLAATMAALRAIWDETLAEAATQIEIVRNPDLVVRLQSDARVRAAARCATPAAPPVPTTAAKR